jgi:hypothetical protein
VHSESEGKSAIGEEERVLLSSSYGGKLKAGEFGMGGLGIASGVILVCDEELEEDGVGVF